MPAENQSASVRTRAARGTAFAAGVCVAAAVAVAATGATRFHAAAGEKAAPETTFTFAGDAEIGGSLSVRGKDFDKTVADLRGEIKGLRTRLEAAEKTAADNRDALAKAAADARVKVATREWVFGLGNVGQGERVPPPEWVPDVRWGKKVVGVVLLPTGCTNEVVSLGDLRADPNGDNRIKITIVPIPGRNVLIRVRAVVFYYDAD